MKKILIIFAVAATFYSCGNKQTDKKVDVIDTSEVVTSNIDNPDTAFKDETDALECARNYNLTLEAIDILKDSVTDVNVELVKVKKTRDSLVTVNRANKEKLGVAEYKLLRIREYNRIAAKGNNVKFLRSWINRTINK